MKNMGMSAKLSNKLAGVRKMGLCPSILNMYSDRYSFLFLLNDVTSGVKLFLLLLPIALALSFFCGFSATQGIISCAIGAVVSAVLGGSKYQVSSVAFPVCLLMFEIMSKYQYKGMLYTSIFISIILILFGLLKMSEVMRHISYAFVSALSVYVIFVVVAMQLQYILGIGAIQSIQGLSENFSLLIGSFENITKEGATTAAAFLVPLIVLKSFYKGFVPYIVYMAICMLIVFLNTIGAIPEIFAVKTVGKEMISGQIIDNIFTISNNIPSTTFLSSSLNYAFVIALIIGSEACFCSNVSSSLTGDTRIQNNMELISTGVSNFLSVACGGLFVSPNIPFSLKNVKYRSKTIITSVVIAVLAYHFMRASTEIFRLLPGYTLSSILLVYAVFDLLNRKITQYLNFKASETYIFLCTLILAIYFGFISATIVGFTMSIVLFAKRVIRIKDATVHTVKNHDAGMIEFMANKNGTQDTLNIPKSIMKRIEVVQISNVLFLNIAKIIAEVLGARGSFPSVLIIYFKNVPYIDEDGFKVLQQIVKTITQKGAIVMVAGTNGVLLNILQQKAAEANSGDMFGYITPDFKTAIQQVTKRLDAGKSGI
jgi:SulP family sulfate permease